MTTTRRTVLQAGCSVIVLPTIAGRLSFGASGYDPHDGAVGPPARFVFDERFSDSRQFSEHARKSGGTAVGIRGDVTKLWYDDLYHLWKAGSATTTGLTTAASLFCLEQLARDHQMRVLFRIAHQPRDTGVVEHRVWGDATIARRAAGVLEGASDWAGAVARLMPVVPLRRAEVGESTVSTQVPGSSRELVPLVSWIIAAKPTR